MTRIEWTRYDGGDIEHAIAMFISSEDSWAEKITPSRGDGGVDILSLHPKTTVYQVKSFTSPLTGNQKKKVVDSLEKLVTDERWQHLEVDEWRLVTPWDPTPEAKNWLQEEARKRGITAVVWDGLTKCDTWAAKYPQIVDYYFHGFRETVIDMAETLLQRTALRSRFVENPDITPADVGATLSEAVAALNRIDPHYSYGVATKPKRTSLPQLFDDFPAGSSPRPVTSKFHTFEELDVRIDIYAKTNLSTELRPIEVGVTLRAQPGSPAEHAIRDFFTYGTPLELPEDSADVSVDAPGGLGGTLTGAAISLRPHEESKAKAQALRMLLLDSDRNVIDELPLERDYISYGNANGGKIPGAETKLIDPTGVLTVILRSVFQEQNTDINFHIAPPENQLADDVLPTMRFLANFSIAQSFVVAPRFGPIPFNAAVDIADVSEDFLEQNSRWYELTNSLVKIQEWASFGINFPDLSSVQTKWLQEIVRVGNLLKGNTEVVGAESIRTHHEPLEINGPTEIRVPFPIQIQFPEGAVSLTGEYSFTGVLQRSAVETKDGVIDEWEVPDHKMYVRVRHPHPASQTNG